MRTVAAIIVGFMSGFLICAMLFVDVGPNSAPPSPALVLGLFFGGWAVSAYFVRHGAATASRVFSRGAVLGAAELIAIVAGVVFSGRAVLSAVSGAGGSDAATAEAAIGGGIIATLTGGFAIAVAVVCLIVFVVAHFTGRETADRSGTPTKKCPECAEMVQAEARKCEHCGASLVGAPAPGTAAS